MSKAQNQVVLPNGHQFVGRLPIHKINSLLGMSLPDVDVLMTPGFVKHVRRRHPGIWEKYGHLLPEIIAAPDFVGQNPKEPDSIELYKQITVDLLLAIKLDPSGYLYCSSLYDVQNAQKKIEKRLNTGRIKPMAG